MNAATSELELARRAWDAVGMDVRDTSQSEYVVITEREHHGWEGLLSSVLFEPKQYALEDLERRRVDAWYEVVSAMRNPHVNAIFKHNLGEYGNRAVIDTLGEYTILAAHKHAAHNICTAMNIMIDRKAGSQTLLSAWDDGETYEDGEALEAMFSHDGARDLSTGQAEIVQPLEQGPLMAVTSTMVVTATQLYGGELTVISGKNRLRVNHTDEKFVFNRDTVPPIIGNVMLARLPHAPQTA